MRLSGIELRNFRSIGPDPVILTPLQKCNVLVGQNNAGKSNVLRAVRKLSDRYQDQGGRTVTLSELDRYRRSQENSFLYKLWFEGDQTEDRQLIQLAKTSTFWFEISWQQDQTPKVTDHVLAHISDVNQSSQLLSHLANKQWTRHVTSEEIRREFLNLGDHIFFQFSRQIPKVYIIPEFRQIREGGEYGFDGTGLINLLARYHMPTIGKDEDQKTFELIQESFRRLLHLPRAVLEVSRDDSALILKNEGIRLPLTSFGTGVHELLMIVTAVTSIENSLCCIEEPEIHLHPRLQRELVEFLIEETSNQYLITTHSATLINLGKPNVQAFHIQSQNGSTIGMPILQTAESVLIIRDLGIKPSDLLQTSCIIWVEGLSDRIYLQRWIELIAPNLVEGRDYIFMCYRNLPKLNINSTSTTGELVNVLQINRNAIVVMDSDKSSSTETLAPFKQEIKDRCQASGGICWITEGREIENYLPSSVICEAIKDLRGCELVINLGDYDEFEDVLNQALKQAGAKPIAYSSDKLNYSRKFAEYVTLASMMEPLQQRIEEIVIKIREWGV